MDFFASAHALIDRAASSSLLRPLKERAVRAAFESNTERNMFDGVFESPEAALASAPTGKPTGYDNDASATLYRRMLYVDAHDYPAMFWLQRAFDEGARSVFDLGGSIGTKFYAFGRHMALPAGLRWTVCDVPAAVAEGRRFADERKVADRLQFTDRPAEMDGVDVLYASGVVQYLPQTLDALLAPLARRPWRLVINTAALHLSRSYWTLNSIGTAHCAYRVQAIEPFCAALEALGYKRRDQWMNLGKSLELPMHPELSLANYTGFCFERPRG